MAYILYVAVKRLIPQGNPCPKHFSFSNSSMGKME